MLTLTNVNFDSNSASAAPGNGGALHISGNGDAMITGGTATNNSAASEGGALWNNVGEMTIDGMTLENNTAAGAASDNGGGAVNNGGDLMIMNGTMIANNLATGTAGSGGGLFSTAGSVIISNAMFDSNSAIRAGGAIEIIDGTLSIDDSDLTNNDVNGVAGTAAPGNGGALHITGNSTVTIQNSMLTGNEAAQEGGALWNQANSTMNIIMTTVDNNLAAGNGGGGIYNNGGDLYIETSTISNNNASLMTGGGLMNDMGSTTILRSTFAGNSATTNGGGMYNNDEMTLNAVTVAMNSAAVNGGGISSMASMSMTNTLVAENTATSGQDVSGMITSGNYNLIGTDDAGIFTVDTDDIVGTSPLLGSLQDNGGATFTIALMDGSEGINAGNPNDTFNDQRDYSIQGRRDIGAYENGGQLGINDEPTVSLAKLYPNPAQGRLTIELPDTTISEVQVKIVSLTGQVVYENEFSGSKNQLDISRISAGIYMVNLNTEGNSTTQKLIVE
ncbi:T9SS type A sorting domain-containing protein [Mesonia maritima]|uniref:T9SS type A sorting domain-containing protein n=1 Tax=Mesonia maritima TaxID=1793873 RepID=UPI00363150D9